MGADAGHRGEVDPVSVSVVAVNHLGVPSRAVDAGTVNPPADTIAPSAPSGVSAIAGFERVGLFWTNPPERDFHAVLVREASSASFGASSLVGSFAGDPGSPGFAERPGLAADAKRYYWLASKDRSRNVSAWVGPVSATPTRIDTHQLAFDAIPPELIADLSLTNRMFANGDLDGTKLRAASITGIQIGANEVLAHHVAIADPENLIPDDDLVDAKAWRFADGWGLFSGSSIAFDSTGHLTVHVADIPTGGSARAWSKAFKVTPGEELYGELQLDAMGSTQGVWSLNFLRTDGSLLSQTHFGDLDTSGSQSLHIRSGSIVVPSGAHSAEVRIEVLENGSFATKRVGGVKIRRKLGGKLIVDGEILTHHLGANVVTADKMAVSELSAISANLGSIVVDKAHIGELSVGYDELDYGAAHVAFQESDATSRSFDQAGQQEVMHSFVVEWDGFLMFKIRVNLSQLGGTESCRVRLRFNSVTQQLWDLAGNTTGLQQIDLSDILIPVQAGVVVDATIETDVGAFVLTFSRLRVIIQQRT